MPKNLTAAALPSICATGLAPQRNRMPLCCPLVLERGYAGCPDMTELSRKLARLYGADLGVDQSSARN